MLRTLERTLDGYDLSTNLMQDPTKMPSSHQVAPRPTLSVGTGTTNTQIHVTRTSFPCTFKHKHSLYIAQTH